MSRTHYWHSRITFIRTYNGTVVDSFDSNLKDKLKVTDVKVALVFVANWPPNILTSWWMSNLLLYLYTIYRQQLNERVYWTAIDNYRLQTVEYHRSVVAYAKKHHYLVSTFKQPGVFNSPCQVQFKFEVISSTVIPPKCTCHGRY